MSGIASGSLEHRVQLQHRVNGQDPDTGAPIVTYVTYARPWADMHYQSVREFVAASAEQSEVRGYCRMYHRDDIEPSDRIVFRGKWFGVLGIMPDNESGIEHVTLPYTEGVRLDQ